MTTTGVMHLVLFKLKDSLTEEQVKEFCDDMLALKSLCVHHETREPYIINSSGGRDNSPEGAQGGFTHGFVVEFSNEEQRDYYVFKDPAHQAFVKKNSPRFDDVRVLDYTKSVY
ncbi:uncharacterized protein HMPREF1541_11121 [Cyphellophora europaea CBS 101466]|uniref:Stress-response A/B barrel domain-containing protein n=1 Tax=Cyphellophora europaea (strain CBS 101466) TaxID=1220924 RepID=W2S537_CYPE1|nr:uncharacterized protein HMPREF1541_11121 [Cyphellophora europaea CBS 101466]ETN43797.1 hypothetical protein HMPREF1541_11121 [Cyphellophora europaea CBS 101466]